MFVKVAKVAVIALMAVCAATAYSQGTAPDTLSVTAGADFKALLTPDFAYPGTVIETARGYLAAHGPATGTRIGTRRLLAVIEESTARVDIDPLAVNSALKNILELAEKEPNRATRAMFLAYAASFCRKNQYYVSGYLTTPDPEKVDVWGSTAFHAAVDSLFNEAYLTAPANAPVGQFAVALADYDFRVGLVRTVRDFILCLWSQNFENVPHGASNDARGDGKELRNGAVYLDSYAPDSPIGFYRDVMRQNGDSLQRRFILENISNPGVAYGIAAWLNNYGNRYKYVDKPSDVYAFLERIDREPLPDWLSPAVRQAIAAIEAPQWRMHFDVLKAGRQLVLRLESRNTDTVSVDIYRYDRQPLSLPETLPHERLSRTLTLRPASGMDRCVLSDTVTFTPGFYVIVNPADPVAQRGTFAVTPWTVVFVQTDPDSRAIQVLDNRSGAPVPKLQVIADRADKNRLKATAVTDRKGLATFREPVGRNLRIRDPKTGLELTASGNWLPYWDYDYPKVDEAPVPPTRVSLTTERTICQPGDTLRWLSVATRDGHAVSGYTDTLTVRLPQRGAREDTELKIPILPSDGFGRSEGYVVIPRDAQLGQGYITVEHGNGGYVRFNVSEFKMPELNIRDVKYLFEGDSVRIGGYVCNDTGAPRAGMPVRLSAYYGKSTDTVTTDSKGYFAFMVPKLPDFVKQINYYSTARYDVEVSTDDGYRAQTTIAFPICRDVNIAIDSPQKIDVVDGMAFSFTTERLGCEAPSEPIKCQWFVAEENYLSDWNNPTEMDMSKVVLSGEAMSGAVNIDAALTDRIKAGLYSIVVRAVGMVGTGSRQVVIYNTAKGELPSDGPVWTPESSTVESGRPFTIGAVADGVELWWAVTSQSDGNAPRKPEVNRISLKKGFQEIKFEADQKQSVSLWAVYGGNEWDGSFIMEQGHGLSADTLSLSIESMRDRTDAGSRQHWTVITRRGDSPVGAAVLLNVYERRLVALNGAPGPLYLNSSVIQPRLFPGAVCLSWFDKSIYGSFDLEAPDFNPDLGRLLFPRWRFPEPSEEDMVFVRMAVAEEVVEMDMVRSGSTAAVKERAYMRSANTAGSADMAAAKTAEGYFAEDEAVDEGATADGPELDDVEVRQGTVLNALWKPCVTTDATTGEARIDFCLPNQSSTWRVSATAWTADLKTKRFERTVTAVRPLSVRPNLPRFVRVGDKVDIVTAVTNQTDSVADIVYDITYGDRLTTGRATIAANSTGYVTASLSVSGAIALADSLTWTFRASNGAYGDGERVTVPILPSSALVVESTPFYLNPGTERLNLSVPASKSEADSTVLSFTANPMWTVVESLKPLVGRDISKICTSTALAGAWYAEKTARLIVEEHPTAAEVLGTPGATAESDALDRLRRMQNRDGGFAWGNWTTASSLPVTLTVLGWFDGDTADSAVSDMVGKALCYVDSVVAGVPAVMPLKSAPVATVNMQYAFVRSAYAKPVSAAGGKVIENTVNHIVRNWKTMALNEKCIASIILLNVGKQELAREIMTSVRQYGVATADRGLVFPRMPGLGGYANMLRAFTSLDSDDPVVDAVRQALVCQRRGASWNDEPAAACAVRALVTSGTEWTVPAEPVTVLVGGKEAEIPSAARLTGAFRLSVEPGSEITLTRTGDAAKTPAYGAVVGRRIVPLSDVEGFATPSLSVTKTLYTTDVAGRRVVADSASLAPGHKVTVSLRVYSDTDMTDIEIRDNRSAALEPVEQTGRYRWTGAAPYYIVSGNTATTLYVDRLPRGYTVFEYETVVNNGGEFTTGVATVTSAVDPDLTAHSASSVIEIRR